MKRSSLITTSLLLISGVLYAAEGTFHIVKNGETLSEIARRHFPGRIYGSGGSLAKVLSFNPDIENPNRVHIGQRVALSRESESSLSQSPLAHEVFRTPASDDSEPKEPVKSCEPTTEQVVLKQRDDRGEVDHRLELSGGYQFTTLSGKDNSSGTSASLYSSHDVMVGGTWSQAWSEKFGSFFSFSARHLDFEHSTNANKTLANTQKTLFAMRAGGVNRLSERFKLGYSLGYEQELFFHGLDSNTVNVDAVPIPSAKVEGDFRLYSQGKTSFGAVASASYLLGAASDGYSVSSGTALSGGIYLRREMQGGHVGLNLGIDRRTQNTSLLEFSEENVFGSLIFSFPLFNERPK